jgi:hypothetical protein
MQMSARIGHRIAGDPAPAWRGSRNDGRERRAGPPPGT